MKDTLDYIEKERTILWFELMHLMSYPFDPYHGYDPNREKEWDLPDELSDCLNYDDMEFGGDSHYDDNDIRVIHLELAKLHLLEEIITGKITFKPFIDWQYGHPSYRNIFEHLKRRRQKWLKDQ